MAKKSSTSNKSESATITETTPAAPSAPFASLQPLHLERGVLQMLGLVKDQFGQLEDSVNILRDQLNGLANELTLLGAEHDDTSAPQPSNPPSAPSPSNPIRTPRPRPIRRIRLCAEPAAVVKEIDDSIAAIRQGMTDLQVTITEAAAKAKGSKAVTTDITER